jgi:MFS family permease
VLGLVEIIPVLAFALVAGHVCDRYDRRSIAVITRLGMLIASVMLLVFAILKLPVSLVLLAVGILATIRTFYSPAIDNLLPRVVDEKHFREAVSWLSLGWQSASVIGPVLAGIIIGSGGHVWRVYIIEIVLGLVTAYGYAQLPKVAPEPPQETDEQGWRSALEGFSFLKTRPALLAAISLDLFAVLLGGAAALLPAFADTVLKVGPVGLGWLQASVNIGALLMSAYLARQPEMKQAGPATSIWSVARLRWVT